MNVVDPQIDAESVTLPRAEFQLVIPDDLLYLRGHFPGRPVVPGVVQIHWAIHLAERHLNLRSIFMGIEALKFHRIMQPRCPVKLSLEYSDSAGKLYFSYESEFGCHSKGRILFE